MPNFLKPFAFTLYPISLLWEFIYYIRRTFYRFGIFKQNDFEVPIISVGNLTFGGTGKTPFTLWVAQLLNQNKKSVMILMRGYKGKLEHSSGVLRSGKRLGYNPFEYGDEALLLARRIKQGSVVVGKKRSQNLDYYFDKERPDAVILDDGHQHLKLMRDCNIVLFDSLMPLENYKVAPLGYMREGFSALKDAKLVVLGRCDQVTLEKREELKKLIRKTLPFKVPIAEICYRPTGFFGIGHKKVLSLEEMAGKRAVCVAGVASPESFYNMVESLGVEIINKYSYPDHHYFTIEEVKEMLDEVEKENAYLLTTEKDIVKMKKVVDDQRILYLEIMVEFLSGEAEARELIMNSVGIKL
ncbi:MAG: tetraacyldisaccharide 4'-kinase [Oligoflexia bacterium]|nr:tetraacyldisaccharide 4'-kinase [Oligoflexia bacterium]